MYLLWLLLFPFVRSCVPDYHQCGGLTYGGETACCSDSAQCVVINDYWHQCNPCDQRRRSVTDPANYDNVRAFIDGVTELKNNGIYDNFTKQHGNATTFFQFHKNALFLPWHRWYVSQLENKIRETTPCFAMPYWDWSADSDDPLGSALWSIIGEANTQGGCLKGGPFSTFLGAFDHKCIQRDTNVSRIQLFSTDELATLVSLNQSFLKFSHLFEDTAHAMPHLLVSHQMSSMPSPDDPLFYLHHAFTDVVLASYMKCHPRENASSIASVLLPYANGLTVRDAMAINAETDYDHQRLCTVR